MLYLDINFSCTQRLMTPANPGIQKSSSESRVYGLFASVFLLIDTGFHLLSGAYKRFVWTAVPTDYYKEGNSHLAKMFCCALLIPFATPLGVIRPSVFQSKRLQDYLGWKITSTCDQKSQTENVRDFSDLNHVVPSCALRPCLNDLAFPQAEHNFPSVSQQSRADVLSITSESDVFEDAVGELSPTEPNLVENNIRIQVLERQLPDPATIS